MSAMNPPEITSEALEAQRSEDASHRFPDDLAELNDTGQRYEVTYYDRRELRRKVCGWTDDAARARKIGDMWDGMDRCIQIRDRSISEQSQTPPASNPSGAPDVEYSITLMGCWARDETPCGPAGAAKLALASLEHLKGELGRLTRERNQLLAAIGEHVTVRSDQYAEIQRLTRERDEWAAKWHRLRADLAELKYPGMKGVVRPLSGEHPPSETATELQMPAELLQFLWHRVIPKLEWSGNNLGIAGDERSYIDMANQLRGMIHAMGRLVRPHRSGGGTSSIPERSAPFIRKPTVYEIQSGACLCGTTDQSECPKHANSAEKADADR